MVITQEALYELRKDTQPVEVDKKFPAGVSHQTISSGNRQNHRRIRIMPAKCKEAIVEWIAGSQRIDDADDGL